MRARSVSDATLERATGVDNLQCPVCDEEDVFVHEQDRYDTGDEVEAYCGRCRAVFLVTVTIEATFGNPRLLAPEMH